MSKVSQSEAIEIVTESEASWESRRSRLIAAERDAYSKYHGIEWHGGEPGSIHAAGYGHMIGGFRGQAEWYAARDLLQTADRLRLGGDSAWSLTMRGSVAVYSFRFAADRIAARKDREGELALEIDTHGVDVSDCPTPTAAIAKVRDAFAATA